LASVTPARIAATAVIEPGATIGDGTVVWDLTQVRSGAVLGARCVIGRNVFIDSEVLLGDCCKVQNNALLYAPARLGHGVFIGPAAVLTNDRVPRAVDPDGEPLLAAEWAAAPVTIGDGAAVGAGAVIVAGVAVGAWALIGASAVVTADVAPHALMVGNPARRIGWVGRGGTRLVPIDGGESLLRCPDTGVVYVDHGDRVEPA
jgi:acetyltransferase-like isoleucine patch superfamily enzyme